MLQRSLESRNGQLFIVWMFGTAIGWGVIVYPALTLRDQLLASWSTLLGIAWHLFIPSLFLGLIVGTLQYFAMRSIMRISIRWIVFSTFGYALGTPIAFLLSAAILGLTFPEIYTGNGNAFSAMPVDTTMFLCGGVLGLFQATELKKYFVMYRLRDTALWVLGSALGWGLGFFSIGYAWAIGLPVFMQSGVAGLVIGLVTGGILLLQLAQTRK